MQVPHFVIHLNKQLQELCNADAALKAQPIHNIKFTESTPQSKAYVQYESTQRTFKKMQKTTKCTCNCRAADEVQRQDEGINKQTENNSSQTTAAHILHFPICPSSSAPQSDLEQEFEVSEASFHLF